MPKKMSAKKRRQLEAEWRKFDEWEQSPEGQAHLAEAESELRKAIWKARPRGYIIPSRRFRPLRASA